MKSILMGVVMVALVLSTAYVANAEQTEKIKGKAEDPESTTKITGQEKDGEQEDRVVFHGVPLMTMHNDCTTSRGSRCARPTLRVYESGFAFRPG